MEQQATPAPQLARRSRVVLICATALGVSVALILCVALAWSPVRAIGAAVSSALIANQGAVAWVVIIALIIALAMLLAAFGGFVRIIWVYGRGLYLRFQKAAVIDMREAPLTLGQLRQERYPQPIIDVAADSYEVGRTAAENSSLGGVTHYSPSIRYEQQVNALPVEDEVPALPAPVDVVPVPPGQSRLQAMHAAGHVCRSGNSLLAGYDEQGKPIYIEMAGTGFILIGGKPRKGKSSLGKLFISQAILMGWHVFAGDPHIHKADGLLRSLTPLSGHLRRQGQAVTPDEIIAQIHLVNKIGQNRVQGIDKDRTPVLLVIDELTNLILKNALPDDVLNMLPTIANEYPGVGVHGLILAHDLSQGGLGAKRGAMLRRATSVKCIFNMDQGNVGFLVPPGYSDVVKQVTELKVGQMVFWDDEGPRAANVPWIRDEDMVYAAQGVAPQPYTPWPKASIAAALKSSPARLAALALTPDEEHVLSASPTLPAPQAQTVKDRILDLIARRGGLDSFEIADTLGIKPRTVQTELSNLQNEGQIIAQPAPDDKQGMNVYFPATRGPISRPLTA